MKLDIESIRRGPWIDKGPAKALCDRVDELEAAITQALGQLQPADGVTAYGPAVIVTLRAALESK